ncbi:hypothetical protein EMCRGX_G000995 [Ephydatia muelleri]
MICSYQMVLYVQNLHHFVIELVLEFTPLVGSDHSRSLPERINPVWLAHLQHSSLQYSLLPPIWSVKKNSLSVSEVYIPRWSASSSGSRLSGDHLVWARDWTHLDEQCGMDCRQPPSR